MEAQLLKVSDELPNSHDPGTVSNSDKSISFNLKQLKNASVQLYLLTSLEMNNFSMFTQLVNAELPIVELAINETALIELHPENAHSSIAKPLLITRTSSSIS